MPDDLGPHEGALDQRRPDANRSISGGEEHFREIHGRAHFTGEPIKVTFVQFSGSREAHASARALDRRRYYAVGLIKPRGRWLIQSVTVKARAG